MRAERHRPWYRLKWAGLTACLVLLTVLAANAALQKIEIEGRTTGLWVFNGCVLVFHQPVGPGLADDVWYNWKIGFANNPRPWSQYGYVNLKAGELVYVSLPIRPPLLLLAIVTLVLWRPVVGFRRAAVKIVATTSPATYRETVRSAESGCGRRLP